MKHVLWKLSAVFTGLACSLAVSFSAMAAEPSGTLEGADRSSVYGWVWDSDDYNHIIPVEISICSSDSGETLKTGTVKADHYQDKLQESIGDGYHGFLYPVDWSQFEQTCFRVTASAVTETERVFLGELTYNKETGTYTMAQDSGEPQGPSSAEITETDEPSKTAPTAPGQTSVTPGQAPSTDQDNTGAPGTSEQSAPAQEPTQDTSKQNDPAAGQAPDSSKQNDTAAGQVSGSSGQSASTGSRASGDYVAPWEKGPGVTPPPKKDSKGESLGIFVTTGYCNCEICCGGSTLTYSGTVPKAQHTISADISLFPIGTKLMIDGIIYTVEDIGSSVVGRKIDIYYNTHEEASDHGMQEKEVFAVVLS